MLIQKGIRSGASSQGYWSGSGSFRFIAFWQSSPLFIRCICQNFSKLPKVSHFTFC